MVRDYLSPSTSATGREAETAAATYDGALAYIRAKSPSKAHPNLKPGSSPQILFVRSVKAATREAKNLAKRIAAIRDEYEDNQYDVDITIEFENYEAIDILRSAIEGRFADLARASSRQHLHAVK